MARHLIPLALLLSWFAVGCGSDDPGYMPKKDDVLFAEIASIKGVTEVNVHGNESAGVGGSRPAYNGQVVVDASADPLLVLDQVLAILWQGMPGADLSGVDVRQVDAFYGTEAVRLGDNRLKERYGPQPGTGVPPTDKPALELPE